MICSPSTEAVTSICMTSRRSDDTFCLNLLLWCLWHLAQLWCIMACCFDGQPHTMGFGAPPHIIVLVGSPHLFCGMLAQRASTQGFNMRSFATQLLSSGFIRCARCTRPGLSPATQKARSLPLSYASTWSLRCQHAVGLRCQHAVGATTGQRVMLLLGSALM